MNTDLVSYYKDRANEYEKIYAKPERQADLKNAASILQEIFTAKHVLEIACGTGYWTEKIAQTASSILATDINNSVIEIAKLKDFSNKNVSFEIADIYNFADNKKYESLFGGFIWSHILLQDLDKFLATITSLVAPGSTVVFMDNNFVAGSNHPLVETDKEGNTYQLRKLDNGTAHLVLKNFPTEEFLRSKVSALSDELTFFNSTYYWIMCYTTKKKQN